MMIRTIVVLAAFALVSSLAAEEPAPATVEASAEVRLAIITATNIEVFEGLPHQGFERELLATESKRQDTLKIASFKFYTPATEARNHEALKSVLASPDTLQVFRGMKLCGGFHPDYAVRWADDKGSEFHALICFGCHEVIYFDGGKRFHYDLADGAIGKLRKELQPYAKKRPKKQN